MHPKSGTTFGNTRLVWAALSADPRCDKTRLAHELGIGRNAVYAAIKRLERAGYIRHCAGDNAYIVTTPFIREFTIHPPGWRPTQS